MDTSIIITAATLHEIAENSIKAQTAEVERKEVEPFLRGIMPQMLNDAKNEYMGIKTQHWIKDNRKREFFQDIVGALLRGAGYKIEFYVPKNSGYVHMDITW